MENANPPLSPSEVALMHEQIENEVRELRELNRLVDIELDYALNDLAIAMDLDKELEPNNLAIVEDVKEEEEDGLDDDYFNLYPTKEEIDYYNKLFQFISH